MLHILTQDGLNRHSENVKVLKYCYNIFNIIHIKLTDTVNGKCTRMCDFKKDPLTGRRISKALKPTWSTNHVPGQLRLQSGTVSTLPTKGTFTRHLSVLKFKFG